VAPFRGFVQERAEQAAKGEEVGKTILFYGCRNEKEDFLYKDDWKVRIHHFVCLSRESH
jgi:NADPH-ferrihemoprotein reductase